ncbi:MAG: YraN family protein [bacterium]|nr:YraN family protein [bacterium]
MFKVTNTLGAWGERTALQAYMNQGFNLVAQNVCNPKGKRFGEIDLIMRKRKVLVFVEVKSRQNTSYGHPAESITYHKQQRLLKTIHWFLHAYPKFVQFQPRIDICIVRLSVDRTQKSVIIIPNAVTDERR